MADTLCLAFSLDARCADGCMFDKQRALIATWQIQKQTTDSTCAKEKKKEKKLQTECGESHISSAACNKRWVVGEGASRADRLCLQQ